MPPTIMPTLSRTQQAAADREGPWMRTYTGRRFYPADPRPEDIHLQDIIQGLCSEVRFAGQAMWRITVAQHSCLVMARVEQLCHERGVDREARLRLMRWALMHDAPEAYLKDIPGPFKTLLPEYRRYETLVMEVIAKKFGMDLYVGAGFVPAIVKEADKELCITEAKVLYGEDGIADWGWENKPLPKENEISRTLAGPPWDFDQARASFSGAFIELWELWK